LLLESFSLMPKLNQNGGRWHPTPGLTARNGMQESHAVAALVQPAPREANAESFLIDTEIGKACNWGVASGTFD
jgi:hypothetical protein